MKRTQRTVLAGVLSAGTLALAGCSSSGGSVKHGGNMMGSMPGMNASSSAAATGTPAAGPHNTADLEFATGMIPHHAQAVYMAQLAEAHAVTDSLRQLAAKVKAAQSPEIAQMSGWLAGGNEPVPAASYTIGAMGGMQMPGMMSDHDMTTLGNTRGTSFDRMWLTMMISHHRGAVGMAKTELAKGHNPAAKALARAIMSTQTAEIATMHKMLADLPG